MSIQMFGYMMGTYMKQMSQLFLKVVLTIKSSKLSVEVNPNSQFAHAFSTYDVKSME